MNLYCGDACAFVSPPSLLPVGDLHVGVCLRPFHHDLCVESSNSCGCRPLFASMDLKDWVLGARARLRGAKAVDSGRPSDQNVDPAAHPLWPHPVTFVRAQYPALQPDSACASCHFSYHFCRPPCLVHSSVLESCMGAVTWRKSRTYQKTGPAGPGQGKSVRSIMGVLTRVFIMSLSLLRLTIRMVLRLGCLVRYHIVEHVKAFRKH